MNKLLFTAVAAAGALLAGPSLAADLRVRARALSGAGGRAGAGVQLDRFLRGRQCRLWLARATADVTFLGPTPLIESQNLSGVMAAVRSASTGRPAVLVLGVEGDLQWSGQK